MSEPEGMWIEDTCWWIAPGNFWTRYKAGRIVAHRGILVSLWWALFRSGLRVK
jgi:hypothetical protein